MNSRENNPIRMITPFNENEWQDPEKAVAYLQEADAVIHERPALLSLLKIFYAQMFGGRK
jgi:hypothetical protein